MNAMDPSKLATIISNLQSAPGDRYLNILTRHGFLEAIRFSKLLELILPEWGNFLDIGANIGLYALIMAQLRPEARIMAYEPSPLCYPWLRENTADWPTIETSMQAVSDREGSCELVSTPAFLAGSYLRTGATTTDLPDKEATTLANQASLSSATTTSLDALVDQYRPTFIKMDIEGHEYTTLAAASSLERHDHILFVECNSWSLNWQGNCDLRRFLKLLDGRYQYLAAIHQYNSINLKDQSNWDHFARLNILEQRFYDIVCSNQESLPDALLRYSGQASKRDLLHGLHCSSRQLIGGLSRRLRGPAPGP